VRLLVELRSLCHRLSALVRNQPRPRSASKSGGAPECRRIGRRGLPAEQLLRSEEEPEHVGGFLVQSGVHSPSFSCDEFEPSGARMPLRALNSRTPRRPPAGHSPAVIWFRNTRQFQGNPIAQPCCPSLSSPADKTALSAARASKSVPFGRPRALTCVAGFRLRLTGGVHMQNLVVPAATGSTRRHHRRVGVRRPFLASRSSPHCRQVRPCSPDSVAARAVMAAIIGVVFGVIGVVLGDQRIRRVYGSIEQAITYSQALRTGQLPADIEPACVAALARRQPPVDEMDTGDSHLVRGRCAAEQPGPAVGAGRAARDSGSVVPRLRAAAASADSAAGDSNRTAARPRSGLTRSPRRGVFRSSSPEGTFKRRLRGPAGERHTPGASVRRETTSPVCGACTTSVGEIASWDMARPAAVERALGKDQVTGAHVTRCHRDTLSDLAVGVGAQIDTGPRPRPIASKPEQSNWSGPFAPHTYGVPCLLNAAVAATPARTSGHRVGAAVDGVRPAGCCGFPSGWMRANGGSAGKPPSGDPATTRSDRTGGRPKTAAAEKGFPPPRPPEPASPVGHGPQ